MLVEVAAQSRADNLFVINNAVVPTATSACLTVSCDPTIECSNYTRINNEDTIELIRLRDVRDSDLPIFWSHLVIPRPSRWPRPQGSTTTTGGSLVDTGRRSVPIPPSSSTSRAPAVACTRGSR